MSLENSEGTGALSPQPQDCVITYGLENAIDFGTTRVEYKLWVDYIFDWFHATLERRWLRILVAIFCTSLIWLVGLLAFALIGHADAYVTAPGVYFYFIGIAWCLNALRWLSQTYHIRTNAVRPCFPVCNKDYKALVGPYAKKATNNWYIFRRSAVIAVVVWVIFFFVITVTDPSVCGVLICTSTTKIGIFPPSLDPWLPLLHGTKGLDRLVSTSVLDMYIGVVIFLVYTGYHLTQSTAPLYARLTSLPIVPFPAVVRELFGGVIRLYSIGALMWTFGIVLAELLYEVQIEPLSVAFILTVSSLSLFAYFLPKRAVDKLSQKSLDEALKSVFSEYYADGRVSTSSGLAEFNQDVAGLIASHRTRSQATEILLAIVTQVIPVGFAIFQSLSDPQSLLPTILRSFPH
jgi:hypothetical protein